MVALLRRIPPYSLNFGHNPKQKTGADAIEWRRHSYSHCSAKAAFKLNSDKGRDSSTSRRHSITCADLIAGKCRRYCQDPNPFIPHSVAKRRGRLKSRLGNLKWGTVCPIHKNLSFVSTFQRLVARKTCRLLASRMPQGDGRTECTPFEA
ncbi:hypothetical protein BDY21DRAFT_219684 [Lineolata rhizophorae]|uniref:Uncharacterized protein n=1 Tax=Lineolata rhizophorae TaxID=578093 RepID=A0A6A6P340_9PEZI|nr:hypothetical protein BDY21DRAFT_219684 [Lineolata rhizophorae]